MYTVYTDLDSVYSNHMEMQIRKEIDEVTAQQNVMEYHSNMWWFYAGQLDILFDLLQGKYC